MTRRATGSARYELGRMAGRPHRTIHDVAAIEVLAVDVRVAVVGASVAARRGVVLRTRGAALVTADALGALRQHVPARAAVVLVGLEIDAVARARRAIVGEAP